MVDMDMVDMVEMDMVDIVDMVDMVNMMDRVDMVDMVDMMDMVDIDRKYDLYISPIPVCHFHVANLPSPIWSRCQNMTRQNNFLSPFAAAEKFGKLRPLPRSAIKSHQSWRMLSTQ